MSQHIHRHRARLVGAVLATTMVASLATAVGPITAVAAHPGVPAAVFDRNDVDWVTWRDQNPAELDAKLLALRADKYLVVDLDIDVLGNSTEATVVAQENIDDRTWWIYDDLTEAQYNAKRAAATTAGLRQTDVESYVLSGVRRFAAVWVENTENFASVEAHGLTDAQFTTWVNQQRVAGRMVVAHDQYLDGAAVRHAAVSVHNPANLDWRVSHGLTEAQYGSMVASLAGFRLLSIDSVRVAGVQRYSAIAVENTNGRAWRQHVDLDLKTYKDHREQYRDEGFRLINVERYATPDGVRYATVWRQDGNRLNWAPRAEVDKLVQAQLDKAGMPGITVAVRQGGVLRYSRGFGYADVENDISMDSSHVLGIASVSKAVTGAMLLELDEQNKVNVTDKLGTHLASGRANIPARHENTTLKNLADNTGCIQHYDEVGMTGFGPGPYATSLDSARHFWNDPLVPGCTVGDFGDYHYSTHGYTVLCAALEQATGSDNTVDLIEDTMTRPFKLGTLRAEVQDAPKVHRPKLYSSSNNEITRPDRSEKYCGGGMESTAPDLANFGQKLLDGEILSAASLSRLWTTTNASNYSYGWGEGLHKNRKVVFKDGSNEGTQSYLRIYPDDDIVISVLSNRKAGGHDMTGLARAIGAELLP
jgi:CubicO group peptidase (beta-lactamase class C family)